MAMQKNEKKVVRNWTANELANMPDKWAVWDADCMLSQAGKLASETKEKAVDTQRQEFVGRYIGVEKDLQISLLMAHLSLMFANYKNPHILDGKKHRTAKQSYKRGFERAVKTVTKDFNTPLCLLTTDDKALIQPFVKVVEVLTERDKIEKLVRANMDEQYAINTMKVVDEGLSARTKVQADYRANKEKENNEAFDRLVITELERTGMNVNEVNKKIISEYLTGRQAKKAIK